MNGKTLIAGAFFAVLASVAVIFVAQQKSAATLAAERSAHSAELAQIQAQVRALEEKLALTEKERDKFKADASEVHRLRGELSTLRKAKNELQQHAPQQVNLTPKAETAPAAAPAIPGSFSSYPELGKFVVSLRAKMKAGELSAEEMAWLQQLKPELEKLESNPETFAAFQASMIQATAGITDAKKVEQIQQTIQKVYENAVQRGLHLQARPQDDSDWIQQRHQIDRRGTTAIQGILDENERAAFDRSFLGVMGVDLGTGVDKTLYPPGFLGEPGLGRQ